MKIRDGVQFTVWVRAKTFFLSVESVFCFLVDFRFSSLPLEEFPSESEPCRKEYD